VRREGPQGVGLFSLSGGREGPRSTDALSQVGSGSMTGAFRIPVNDPPAVGAEINPAVGAEINPPVDARVAGDGGVGLGDLALRMRSP